MGALAITRAVPASFARALVRRPPPVPIDVEAARAEHAAYVEALRRLGFGVTVLPADDRHPDSCFVEDCAVVYDGRALLARPGAPSRRGEVAAVADALEGLARIETVDAPATLEGGDCLRIGGHLYIGCGARTNDAGIARARAVFGLAGLEVHAVPIGELLHLKEVCTSPGRGRVLLARDTLPPQAFASSDPHPLLVPAAEAHAANCVALGDAVLIPRGCPATERILAAAGFRVHTVENGELRKADSALTCLSIRIETSL